jgi:hypothetical protein
MRQWGLGLDVSELAMMGGAPPAARFTLTDQANVTLELLDAAGQSIVRRSAGVLPAGIHTLPLRDEDVRAASGAGEVMCCGSPPLELPRWAFSQRRTPVLAGGAAVGATQSRLLGNSPNP